MQTRAGARRLLLELWVRGLAAVDGRASVRRYLERHPVMGPMHVVAVGKAAGAMTLGACDALDAALASTLVITKAGHAPAELAARAPGLALHIGGHPVPTQASIAAGEAMLAHIDHIPQGESLLFLISGGASSLAEVPAPGITLELLIRATDWLLGSGWPIDAMNAVRSRLSQLKGGRLLERVRAHRVTALLISDVPDDDPAVIGSGMLVAQHGGDLPEGVPDWLRARLDRLSAPPARFAQTVELAVVARPEDARDAVAAAARNAGLTVEVWPQRFAGDAHDLGERVAARLTTTDSDVIVAVGESTVRLPADPGRGGRCQALALAAARVLDGGVPATLLAAGTDGTDGPTEDAGAIVDEDTVVRGRDAGFGALASLERAASGEFLAATGDLVTSGPTGTNVCDLLIGVSSRGHRTLAAREVRIGEGA